MIFIKMIEFLGGFRFNLNLLYWGEKVRMEVWEEGKIYVKVLR